MMYKECKTCGDRVVWPEYDLYDGNCTDCHNATLDCLDGFATEEDGGEIFKT